MAAPKHQAAPKKVSISIPPPTQEVITLCTELILTDDQLKQIMQVFLEEVKKGLGKATHEAASVKCFNTFIQDLPTGKEQGQFLGLVFDSIRLRVLNIKISDKVDIETGTYEIATDIMCGSTPTGLFDFVAQCIIDFCEEGKLNYKKIPLGFTFGFTIKQASLNAGILQNWAKGFNCPDSVGKDVVGLLKASLAKKNAAGIEVLAIINDTSGTLISCAFKNATCSIGLVICAGYNICYVEDVLNVELFAGDKEKPKVIINTECGAFGDKGELHHYRTEYDLELDHKSNSPGLHLNEKMISGMYIGEVVRLVFFKAIKKKYLFGGKGADTMNQRNDISLKHVGDICSDAEGSFTNCKRVLTQIGVNHPTEQDMVNVKYICECVYKRSAHLTASQLATLINKMGEQVVTIGVDGSVYKGTSVYQKCLTEKLKQLVEPSCKVDFVLSEDGGGLGAALVAAATSTGRQPNK